MQTEHLEETARKERELEQKIKKEHREAKAPNNGKSHGRGTLDRTGKLDFDNVPCRNTDSGGRDNEDRKVEETSTEDAALKAVMYAKDIMDKKHEFDSAQEKRWEMLPLFRAGNTYTEEEAINGFRIMDGCRLLYKENNQVCIMAPQPGDSCVPDKIVTIINEWSDGGLAWMYWTNKIPNGSNGLLLEECVIRHGMGGWIDSEKDIRAKVVFLDEDRSIKPKKCFILAMDMPSSGKRVMVKGNELNSDVFRVFRSAVPDRISKVIALRGMINERQLKEAGGDPSMCMADWWHM